MPSAAGELELAAPRLKSQSAAGPVYEYEPTAGVPPVGILRLDRAALVPVEAPGTHAHDFPGLAYFERGGGSLRSVESEWRVQAGDVYVVAPGAFVGLGGVPGLERAEGWSVYFTPEVFGRDAPAAFLSWRAHPLLLPFVRGDAGGVLRLRVPRGDRASWSERLAALERELRHRPNGYAEAATAHLTLLLVGVSRLAADVVAELALNDEPLLADVFAFIEAHFSERISLHDVASTMALTPGHLTTTVRRKTGRTVQDWIIERRMVEARRLLVETDLTTGEVGARVGYADAAYFTRVFRRVHGTTPLRWRAASRP